MTYRFFPDSDHESRSTVVSCKDGRLFEVRRGDITVGSGLSPRFFSSIEEWRMSLKGTGAFTLGSSVIPDPVPSALADPIPSALADLIPPALADPIPPALLAARRSLLWATKERDRVLKAIVKADEEAERIKEERKGLLYQLSERDRILAAAIELEKKMSLSGRR